MYPIMSTDLSRVLKIMDYEDDEIKPTSDAIGSMRRVMMMSRDTRLDKTNLSPGMVDELMCLKDWYVAWRKGEYKDVPLKEAFMEDSWNEFIIQKYEN